MPIYIHPETRQRILHQDSCTDIQFPSSEGGSAVDLESKKVLGPWTDYTGSGGIDSRNQQMFGGVENQFFGTDTQLDGQKLGNLNEVGQNNSIFRRRQKIVYVDLKK